MPASKARDRASSISRSDHSESSGTDPFDFPEEDHDRARPTTKDKGKAPIRPNQTKAVNQTKPLPPASYHEESETESETESDLTDYNAGPSTRNSIWKKPVHGNLVSDLAVPLKILDKVPHANPPNRDEFSHLRYQAITCEALDFISEGYCLRASLFGNPRTTEIMVSVSIYNEDAQVLGRMLEAVFANIAYLCERVKDGVWGKDSWRKVVLVLVNDGAGIFNASSRALLAGLGIYTDDCRLC